MFGTSAAALTAREDSVEKQESTVLKMAQVRDIYIHLTS
jgi:hypothetical protein